MIVNVALGLSSKFELNAAISCRKPRQSHPARYDFCPFASPAARKTAADVGIGCSPFLSELAVSDYSGASDDAGASDDSGLNATIIPSPMRLAAIKVNLIFSSPSLTSSDSASFSVFIPPP